MRKALFLTVIMAIIATPALALNAGLADAPASGDVPIVSVVRTHAAAAVEEPPRQLTPLASAEPVQAAEEAATAEPAVDKASLATEPATASKVAQAVPAAAPPVAPPVVSPTQTTAVPTPVAVEAKARTVDHSIPTFDTSSANEGVIWVNYKGTVRARLEVRLGDVKYYYNLFPGLDSFPLQLGDGQYTVTVLENTTGNRYRVVERETFGVSLRSPFAPFLASVQEINWDEYSLAARKAAELTAGLSNDRDKLAAVHAFVVNNIRYDAPKLATLTSTYLPDIDDTLLSGSGICYDHASLMAAMLRSLNIPTKMAKGYAANIQGFHAWNEVYIDGQWLIIDASVDAQAVARGARPDMIKSEAIYQKTQEI